MNEPTTPKYCKDCKHFNAGTFFKDAVCDRHTKAEVDLVYGMSASVESKACFWCRNNEEDCGKAAHFFQPKVNPSVPSVSSC